MLRTNTKFVFLGLLAAIASNLAAECTPRALVIGISVYKDPAFSLLPNARADAVAFSEWFQANARCGGARESKVKPVVTLLTDAKADQTSIMRELTSALRNASREDELFLFVSARGIKTPDYVHGYLIGFDGMRGKLHPSGILIDNIRDAIQPGRSVRRVFVFADISRDLPKTNEIVSTVQDKLQRNPIVGAVLSARARQVSTEAAGRPRGLFTHVLIDELKSRAKAPISLETLFQNLRRKVMSESKQRQEPVSFGNSNATVAEWRSERILMASMAPFAPPEPEPPVPPQDGQAFVDSFDLEARAQAILLRYGEGNLLPGDPLRPGATNFHDAADLFERANHRRPRLPVEDLEDRLRASVEARALFCRGAAIAYSGQFDTARRFLQQAIARDSLLPEPHNALGITYIEQGQYTTAAEYFQHSIDLAPDWAYPRHNLALTYVEQGDNAAAERAYLDAIARMPQHPYLHYNLGVLYQRTNRREDAERAFKAAILRFQEQAEAHRQRAELLKTEAAAEAEIATQEAATVSRHEGEAHNSLGALWQAARKPVRAKSSYFKALALNPELHAARYNLAMLALRERRYEDAIEGFETVIQADSGFPMARERLACAKIGVSQSQSRDRETRRRLGRELKSCLQ